MERLSANSIIQRARGFVESEADGEMVALNVDRGFCYGLNKVGTRVWALIAEPRTVVDLCSALVSEYAVDPATCEREVLELLEELRSEGMIDLHEAAARK